MQSTETRILMGFMASFYYFIFYNPSPSQKYVPFKQIARRHWYLLSAGRNPWLSGLSLTWPREYEQAKDAATQERGCAVTVAGLCTPRVTAYRPFGGKE